MNKNWNSEAHKVEIVLPKFIEVKDDEEITQDTLENLSNNRGDDE